MFDWSSNESNNLRVWNISSQEGQLKDTTIHISLMYLVMNWVDQTFRQQDVFLRQERAVCTKLSTQRARWLN